MNCPLCHRLFGDENAVWQHMKAVHGSDAAAEFRAEHCPREPSMAEELVDALMSAACGDPVPEHIGMMFPDEIASARQRGRKA